MHTAASAGLLSTCQSMAFKDGVRGEQRHKNASSFDTPRHDVRNRLKTVEQPLRATRLINVECVNGMPAVLVLPKNARTASRLLCPPPSFG